MDVTEGSLSRLSDALLAGAGAGGSAVGAYVWDSLYEPASLAKDVVTRMAPGHERSDRMMRQTLTRTNEKVREGLQETYNFAYRHGPDIAVGVAAGVTGGLIVVDAALPGPGGEGKAAPTTP